LLGVSDSRMSGILDARIDSALAGVPGFPIDPGACAFDCILDSGRGRLFGSFFQTAKEGFLRGRYARRSGRFGLVLALKGECAEQGEKGKKYFSHVPLIRQATH